MFQCVIFDMDGVIIDSEPLHYKVFEQYCGELGFEASEEEYDSFIGSTDLDMFTFLRDKYHLPETVENMVQYKRTMFFDYLKHMDKKPIQAVDELIRELASKGIKLALASSSDMDIIHLILDKFGIAHFFDVVVSGTELERSKPAPDIFLKAAERLNVEPGACLVIEDSRNGIAAAKAAGMKCIGFRNPNSGNQDLSAADKIICHFNELDCETLINGNCLNK